MTNHRYKLSMDFHTDGDFGWNFVPIGMTYDDYEIFSFERTFETIEEKNNWASTALTFLVNNVNGRGVILNRVIDMLNELKIAMLEGKDFCQYIDGNYDGTCVSFVDEGDEISLRFSVPEDLFNRMKNCDFNHDDFVCAMRHMVDEKEGNI